MCRLHEVDLLGKISDPIQPMPEGWRPPVIEWQNGICTGTCGDFAVQLQELATGRPSTEDLISRTLWQAVEIKRIGLVWHNLPMTYESS